MTTLLACIALIFALVAAHEVRSKQVWRRLYLHEQQLRNETQEKLIASDDLLSDYALALERRDATLLLAQRRLNASRLGLMADTSRLTHHAQ